MENNVHNILESLVLQRMTGRQVKLAFLSLLLGSVLVILMFVHFADIGTSYAAGLAAHLGVYVGAGDGALYKLDATNGKGPLWRFQTQGRTVPDPATVTAGVVYFGATDGIVYALQADTGKELWHFQTGGPVVASPAVDGTAVYVGSSDGNLYALNVTNGAKIWSYFAGQTGETVTVNTAVVDQGVVYGSSSNQTSHSYLFALDAAKGTQLWRVQVDNQNFTAPQVVNGVIYIASSAISQPGQPASTESFVYAYNATDGSLRWRSTAVKDFIQAAPAVANGVVYFGSRDTNVYALNADTGAQVWQHNAGGAVNDSPQIVDGVVYVGESNGSMSGGSILALNATDGSQRWQHAIQGYVGANIVVSGKLLYVGALNSVIYALNAGDGSQAWSHQDSAPFSNEPITVG